MEGIGAAWVGWVGGCRALVPHRDMHFVSVYSSPLCVPLSWSDQLPYPPPTPPTQPALPLAPLAQPRSGGWRTWHALVPCRCTSSPTHQPSRTGGAGSWRPAAPNFWMKCCARWRRGAAWQAWSSCAPAAERMYTIATLPVHLYVFCFTLPLLNTAFLVRLQPCFAADAAGRTRQRGAGWPAHSCAHVTCCPADRAIGHLLQRIKFASLLSARSRAPCHRPCQPHHTAAATPCRPRPSAT